MKNVKYLEWLRSLISKDVLVISLCAGLIGFYFQLHRIFLNVKREGIAEVLGGSFLSWFAVAMVLSCLLLPFAQRSFGRTIQRGFRLVAIPLVFLAPLYATYVVYINSMGFIGHPMFIIFLKGIFLYFVVLVVAFILPFRKFRISNSIIPSIICFIFAATGLTVRFETTWGLFFACLYSLYILSVGYWVVLGFGRLVSIKFERLAEKLCFLLVFGLLGNYLLWYTLGRFSFLSSTLAAIIVFTTLITTVILNRGRLASIFRGLFSDIGQHKLGFTNTFLLNVVLFSLLLLYIVLSAKMPGDGDSSARMYYSSIYKYAKLGEIAFPPFFQHWGLIYLPQLFEVTGLPLFLLGDLSALRYFNGSWFLWSLPFLVLFCQSNNFSQRTPIYFLLLYFSSSVLLFVSVWDKPDSMSFFAVAAFIVTGLRYLKLQKEQLLLLLGGLLAIVYNSKPVHVPEILAISAVFFCCYWLQPRSSRKYPSFRMLLASVTVVILICGVHAGQNLVLRKNPFHPFGSDVFTYSKKFPEEVVLAKAGKGFYERTIPLEAPSYHSGLNLDAEKGMYKPLIPVCCTKKNRGLTVWTTRHQGNTVAFILIALCPLIILLLPRKEVVIIGVLSVLGFYIWFGWIGDHLRYSTFYTSLILFVAILLGSKHFPSPKTAKSWRFCVISVILCSMPLSLYAPFRIHHCHTLLEYLIGEGERPALTLPRKHAVTEYLESVPGKKPILLVADIVAIGQYGFYQPNFLYQPLRWKKAYINLTYISKIEPTHLLTDRDLKESILTQHYPFLSDYLIFDRNLTYKKKRFWLYRFKDDIPWGELYEKYSRIEKVNPDHLAYIESLIKRFRKRNAH